MSPRPWYAAAPSAPSWEEEEEGYRVQGRWFPRALFSSPEGEPWPSTPTETRRLLMLLKEYIAICHLAQVEFPIVGAYRLSGRHARCYAFDLAPVKGWSVTHMAVIARQHRYRLDSRLTGIGIFPDYLHIDIQPRTVDTGRWTADRNSC